MMLLVELYISRYLPNIIATGLKLKVSGGRFVLAVPRNSAPRGRNCIRNPTRLSWSLLQPKVHPCVELNSLDPNPMRDIDQPSEPTRDE